jgi:predicted enzyme related to lactoylglutathione lyase
MVRRLRNVHVAATDLTETVRFYRDVLGLRLKFQDGGRWAQFDLDGAAFAVSGEGESVVDPGTGAVVVFEVEDLESAKGWMRSRGVALQGEVVDMGAHGRYVTVLDPSGNPVQLFEQGRSNGGSGAPASQ